MSSTSQEHVGFAAISREFETSDVGRAYARRHGIKAAAHLTVTDDETASLIAAHLAPRIEGRTVIEIGGGIGLLSLHLARIARRVYCIEANPLWSLSFVELLMKAKPANASFLFGAADEFVGTISGEVALFCTHSGVGPMTSVAKKLAPEVIDVYGELVAANPSAFDPFAREARRFV